MILNHCQLTAKQTSNLQTRSKSTGDAEGCRVPAGPTAPRGAESPSPFLVQPRSLCRRQHGHCRRDGSDFTSPARFSPNPTFHRTQRCLRAFLSESPVMNFGKLLSPSVLTLKSLIRCPFTGERKKLDWRKNKACKLGRFTK